MHLEPCRSTRHTPAACWSSSGLRVVLVYGRSCRRRPSCKRSCASCYVERLFVDAPPQILSRSACWSCWQLRCTAATHGAAEFCRQWFLSASWQPIRSSCAHALRYWVSGHHFSLQRERGNAPATSCASLCMLSGPFSRLGVVIVYSRSFELQEAQKRNGGTVG